MGCNLVIRRQAVLQGQCFLQILFRLGPLFLTGQGQAAAKVMLPVLGFSLNEPAQMKRRSEPQTEMLRGRIVFSTNHRGALEPRGTAGD